MSKIFSFVVFITALLILSLFPSSVYADITIEAPGNVDHGINIPVTVTIDEETWKNNDPELIMITADGPPVEEVFCAPLAKISILSVPTRTTGGALILKVVKGKGKGDDQRNFIQKLWDDIKKKLKTQNDFDLKSLCNHPDPVEELARKEIVYNTVPAPGNGGRTISDPACTLRRNKNASFVDSIQVRVTNWDCTVPAYVIFLGPKHFDSQNLTFLGKEQTKPGACFNSTITHLFLYSLVTDYYGNKQHVAWGDYKVEVRKNSFIDPAIVTSCTYNNKKEDPSTVDDFVRAPPHPPPCLTKGPDGKCLAVDTAVGGIDTDPASFIKKLFAILLSLSGGVALILIIISGYRLMTSSGNPEKVQAAQETLTSAIVGLLFVLFSLVILEVIGVDLLRIPGLDS